MKIYVWFGYNPQIIFYPFFRKLNLAIFLAFLLSKRMEGGYVVCASPPTVYIDSFETSQVFGTWSEDMHVVWI